MAWLQKLSSAWESIEAARKEHGDLESVKQTSRNVFGAAADKASEFREKARQRADQAAEKFAQTAQEWTGRDVSAADVKRSAKIGAVVGAVVAAGPVVGIAMRQARSAGRPDAPAHPGVGNGQESDEMIGPDVPTADPTADWEQDDIEYDQMQYDHLQDHIEHQDQLNDVIDEQTSYNDGMDMGFDCDF